MLIHNKDDIELVTEFQCLLGHPVAVCIYIYHNEYINTPSPL